MALRQEPGAPAPGEAAATADAPAAASAASAASGSNDAEEGAGGGGWDVLDDNYLLDAKMTDWEKESKKAAAMSKKEKYKASLKAGEHIDQAQMEALDASDDE